MRRLFPLILLLSPVFPANASDRIEWRVSWHEPILCLVFCYEGERDPKNIEVALATFSDDSIVFHEWVASATGSPGRWRYESVGPLHDVYLTQGGILWGVRNDGPVNFIAKTGVLASWLHVSGSDSHDEVRLTPRIELGIGIAEDFELTFGIGLDGFAVHAGWRF